MHDQGATMGIHTRTATRLDVPLILSLIKELAEYERLLHEMNATEEQLAEHLFGPSPKGEVLIAELPTIAQPQSDDLPPKQWEAQPVGFALYFHNFSTFVGKPGIYLEDLYVKPEHRGKGIGKRLLRELAKIAVTRGCGRLEWSVLDWNEPAIKFYKSLHAQPMDEWTVFRVTGDALKDLAQGV
jgi:GNAT superfamily N-acetyltransferase